MTPGNGTTRPFVRAARAVRIGSGALGVLSVIALVVTAVRPSVTGIVLAAASWWATSLALLWSSYTPGGESSSDPVQGPPGTGAWWRNLFFRPHTARDLQRTSFLAFLLCSGFLCAVLLALVAP